MAPPLAGETAKRFPLGVEGLEGDPGFFSGPPWPGIFVQGLQLRLQEPGTNTVEGLCFQESCRWKERRDLCGE